VQQEKNPQSRTQLDQPTECASGGDPLLIYEILYLLFFPLVRIICALCFEGRKIYQHVLDAGRFEFQFLRPSGRLNNPLRTLSLSFGVIGKTPGPISCNNFVTKTVCFGHLDNVLERSYSIFPLLRCQGVWKKCTKLSIFSFRIRRNIALGLFKDSAIILDAIIRPFFTKSATAAFSHFESILDSHPSHHLLPVPFGLEIENTT
jgi:hypothetical protein